MTGVPGWARRGDSSLESPGLRCESSRKTAAGERPPCPRSVAAAPRGQVPRLPSELKLDRAALRGHLGSPCGHAAVPRVRGCFPIASRVSHETSLSCQPSRSARMPTVRSNPAASSGRSRTRGFAFAATRPPPDAARRLRSRELSATPSHRGGSRPAPSRRRRANEQAPPRHAACLNSGRSPALVRLAADRPAPTRRLAPRRTTVPRGAAPVYPRSPAVPRGSRRTSLQR